MSIASGVLLLLGFLTPLVGVVVGLVATCIVFTLLPVCSRLALDSSISMIFAATILLAIVILGPGAFSLDARVFGRREIIIPPAHRTGGASR